MSKETKNPVVEASKKSALDIKYANAIRLAGKYAQAVNERDSTETVLKSMKKDATNAINDYNRELARVQYCKWAANGGNVVEQAIKVRYIPDAKAIKYDKDDAGNISPNLVPSVRKASLLEIAKDIGVAAFNNEEWYVMLQYLARLEAERVALAHGHKDFKYAVEQTELVNAFHFPNPDNAKIHSTSFLNFALQQTYDAILFVPDESGENTIKLVTEENDDGIPVAHQWAKIESALTAAGAEANETIIKNCTKMAEYIMDCMHTDITGKEYKVVQ